MIHPSRNRRKQRVGQRLAWYAQPATEVFWENYWQNTVTKKAFDAATGRLERFHTGRALLRHLAQKGVHLEAGCGPGFWVHALRSRGFSIYGVDFSLKPLSAAAALIPGIPLLAGDVLRLPFDDEVFDSYLSFGVIEHREAGPEPFLREAYRVLKKGGLIIVSVPSFGIIRRLKAAFLPHRSPPPMDLAFYQYGFAHRELEACLRAEGFRIVEHFYEGAHRLLQEEMPGYAPLTCRRGGRHLKNLVEAVLGPFDGHMLVVVGKKALGAPKQGKKEAAADAQVNAQ